MPSSQITPQTNETNAPYQFDGAVTVNGAMTVTGTTSFSGTVAGPTVASGPTTLNGITTIAGVNVNSVLSPLAPSNVLLKAWTFPTTEASGTASAVTVGGTIYLTALNLTSGQTYGTIFTRFSSNGGGASAGSNFAGVYNSLGTLVATTADNSGSLGTTVASGTAGYLTFPLATALTALSSGPYYIGMFFNASTAGSFPIFNVMTGLPTITTHAGLAAGPLGTQPFPYSTIATTSATAMPATFTLGSAGTTGAYVYWAGLA